MKFGDRFSNLLGIECTKFYSDLTFLLYDVHGITFFRTQCTKQDITRLVKLA